MLPGRHAFSSALLATSAALATSAMLAACGDDGPAEVDARPIDGVPLDVPDGCDPATVYFAGELLEWESTAAMPKGIPSITISQRGDATKTTSTTNAGAFELCLANDPLVVVDVTPPSGSDVIGGLALVDKDVLAGGGAYTIRTLPMPRATTEYNFDTAKGHVYVRVNNAARRVMLSSTFEQSFVFDGQNWTSGEDTGQDVFFANVDPATGETKVAIERAVGVPANVPLEVGKLTFVVVNAMN